MAVGFFRNVEALCETVVISTDSSHHHLQVVKVFYVKTGTVS